ncbi:MAG TPA: hypothetical protein DF383_06870 [Deltaproteobacteria bacterium]|nr:hypothetical protein [Deltaproteobacteria bacterium]
MIKSHRFSSPRKLTSLFVGSLALLLSGALSCGGGNNFGPANPSPNNPAPENTAPTAELVFPPSAHFSTTASSIIVRGKSTDSDGVKAVHVNGIEATSEDGFAHWQAEIPLVPGENPIVVASEDQLSHQNSQAANSSIWHSAFLSGPSGIAEDGEFFYVTDAPQGAVLRVSKEGKSAEVIFNADTDSEDSDLVYPGSLAIDGDRIYVTDPLGSAVLSIPKAGGGSVVVNNSDLSRPEAVVVDGPDLYVVDSDLDKVFRIPKEGGPAEEVTITGGPKLDFPRDMVLDGEDLYIVDSGYGSFNPDPVLPSVIRIKKQGGQASELVFNDIMFPNDIPLQSPTGIALDGNDLYVTSSGFFVSIVLAIPKVGNQPSRMIFTNSSAQGDINLSYPTALIVTGPDLYVADSGRDSLLRIPKGGGEASEFIFDDDANRNPIDVEFPRYLVADEECLYFQDSFSIFCHPKAGGIPRTIFNDNTAPDDIDLFYVTGMTADESDLYVVNAGWGLVVRIPKTGGRSTLVEPLDADLFPRALTLHGDDLYVVDSNLGQVLEIPKTGGSVKKIFDDDTHDTDVNLYNPQSIAADDDYVYIAENYSQPLILRINKADPQEKGTEVLFDNSMAEGGVRLLSDPRGMVLYENHLYVVDSDLDHLLRISTADGSTKVVFGPDTVIGDTNLYFPFGVAVDDEHFYIADTGLDALVLIDRETSQSLVFRGL